MKSILLALALATALVAPVHAQRYIASSAVTVALGTTDEVLVFQPSGARRFGATVVIGGQALDAFQINVKYHASDASYQTLYSTAGSFTSPAGILVGASGDLTAAAVGSHWFILDVSGIYEVQIKASSGNAAGSAVTVRGALTQ
jgi:hypothetical protein